MAMSIFRRGVVIIRNKIEVDGYDFYITSDTIKAVTFPKRRPGSISLDKIFWN